MITADTRWVLFSVMVVLLAAERGANAQNPTGAPRTSGAVYADPALYAQRKAEWLTRVEASPQDVDVLGQAAQFLIIRDRPLAQNLFERARAIEPENPKWTEQLAQVHKLNAANGDVAEALAALAEMERAHAMAPANDRALPAGLPEAAFEAGEIAKAAAYATQLLNEAATYRTSWNYGNAIHQGNLVLGRIAVREGRLADAVKFLHASGETPGSPQLNSFGPNMTLARDLLEQGRTQAVLDYFALCRVFWKMDAGRLDAWTEDVHQGRVPNFAANLHY